MPTSRPTQASGHPVPKCVRAPHARSDLTPPLASLGAVPRLQSAALPASRPALTPGPGFTPPRRGWGGSAPGSSGP